MNQTLSIRRVPVVDDARNNLRALKVVKLIREATGLGLKEAAAVFLNASGDAWIELKRDDLGYTPWIERLKTQFEALGVETRVV